ncbi:MAG TPA: hypothetical protein VF517_14150, partial [Thermoleophilaceae bacterium]
MIGYAELTSPDEEAQRQGFRAIRFALQEPPGERGVFDQLVLARGEEGYPKPADEDLHEFVEKVAERWRPHQSKKDGRYLDPVNGIAASGY